MKSNGKNEHLIFLDIETVACFPSFEELPDDMKALWLLKARSISLSANVHTDCPSQLYKLKAGIYAEFSKVICVSISELYPINGESRWRRRSFYHRNEQRLLKVFSSFIQRKCLKQNTAKFIGHNIREFDIPFLLRRMLINGVHIPKILNIRGCKPWQIPHIEDTMNLWKFGDFKNYTSLNLLAKILNVPSPKESLDGSKIHDAYWVEGNYEGIVKYCESDVATTSQVYFKLIQKPYPKSGLLTNR